jgi:hypothetical protein
MRIFQMLQFKRKILIDCCLRKLISNKMLIKKGDLTE